MLDEVLAAYLDKDADKARKAAALDEQLDAEQANLIETLFGVMQSSPVTVPNASRMLWISHNLEHCGDRATNIAEHVVFMLEAEVVELD
jgi:phosphate transport system protein